MKKAFFIILLALCAMPLTTVAECPAESTSEMSVQNEPQIAVEDGVIHVMNAQGKTVYVYNLTGAEVYRAMVNSANFALEKFTPQSGSKLFIVKVAGVARKVNLK